MNFEIIAVDQLTNISLLGALNKKIKIDRETKKLLIEAIKQQSKFTIHIPGRNIEYVIIDKFVIMASMTVD